MEELNNEPEQFDIEDVDEAWERGYGEGYQACIDAMHEQSILSSNYDDGYSAGFSAGIEVEQERIQQVLNSWFEAALNMGQGNKAVYYRQTMDILKPIEIKPYVEDEF
jgi:hypothetical protein